MIMVIRLPTLAYQQAGLVPPKEGNKPGSGVYVKIEITGASSGQVSMSIQVSADGNASATLSDNFGDRLTYRGRIVPLPESSVYKGQVVYQ